ncbi:hypothetical protein D3C80_1917680 [compost metagenome]
MQAAAALQGDLLAAGQAWVAKLQGPAQVTLPGPHLVGAGEGVADIVGVGVQLLEVGPQGRQPLYLMQGIAKGDLFAVQFCQRVEVAPIEAGEALGELL